MALSLFVDAAERGPGPDQERFGGVQAAAEFPGDLGYRQAVQVAQRQRRAVMRRQPGQSSVGSRDVELRIPGILRRSASQPITPSLRRSRSIRRQWSTSL